MADTLLPARALLLLSLLALSAAAPPTRRAPPRPAGSIACSPDKRKKDPGCLWCAASSANQCVSCRGSPAYQDYPVNNLCGCTSGYGSTIATTVLKPPAGFPTKCTSGGIPACTCRLCPAGTTSNGGPLETTQCGVAEAMTCSWGVFQLPLTVQTGIGDLSKVFWRIGDMSVVLRLTEPEDDTIVVDDKGLFIGNDCSNDVRSFTLAFTGLPPGKNYKLYSVFIGSAAIDRKRPVILSITGNPSRCASNNNRPTAISPTQLAPLGSCVVAGGDTLSFSVTYGPPDVDGYPAEACDGDISLPSFVKISSLTFVPV